MLSFGWYYHFWSGPKWSLKAASTVLKIQLCPKNNQICNSEWVENGISDSGENDSEEDDGQSNPVDSATSGIIAGFLQRVRMKGRSAHSGGEPGQIRSRNYTELWFNIWFNLTILKSQLQVTTLTTEELWKARTNLISILDS